MPEHYRLARFSEADHVRLWHPPHPILPDVRTALKLSYAPNMSQLSFVQGILIDLLVCFISNRKCGFFFNLLPMS